MAKQYLLASDFDQTLSFNDSGVVLSELIGFHGFHDKVKGLAEINLVQQGAELSYLILHDPDFRRVRREHLIETGKRIRLKHDVALFARTLDSFSEGYKFHFNVISAAPEEVIQSALEGIVPPDHIFGTRFQYAASGEIQAIIRVAAGYGKVAVLEDLRTQLQVGHDRLVYVGDGSSDVPVMLHVNRLDGLRWMSYGVLIHAVPIIVANLIVAALAVFSSFRPAQGTETSAAGEPLATDEG